MASGRERCILVDLLPVQRRYDAARYLLCAPLYVTLVATVCLAHDASAQDIPLDVVTLAKAVVTIETTTLTGGSLGSGFIVDSSGIIATAAHVLAGATHATVRLSTGEVLPIEGALDVDARLDIALVRIAGFALPTAKLGNSDSLTVGQRLLAIGSPLGLEATVTDGLLSSVRVESGVKRLQSHSNFTWEQWRSSVQREGQVVGLVVSGYLGGGAENLNFAVPINYVRGRLEISRSKPLQTLAEATATIPLAASSTTTGVGSGEPNRVNNNLGLHSQCLWCRVMDRL